MKKVLLPLLYFGIVGVMAICFILIISGIQGYATETPTYKYTVDNIFISDIMNVASEVNDNFVRPYVSDKVTIKRYFYNKEDDKSKQEQSLILYENTYIQNKGVDYTSEEAFDIVSICDGEVVNIEDSELYNKIVTIKLNDNFEVKYYNLSNVLVSVGSKVSQGEIIAVSSPSEFDKDSSLLHFEIIYQGKYINPEETYNLNISSFN